MEAILCLRRHPVTASTFLFTSNVSNPSTISRHVSFSHSSLLFTSSRHQQVISHGHTLVTCAINRRNNGDEVNKPKATATVGVALALACVLGIISCSGRMYPRAMAAISRQQMQPVDAIPSGKTALGYFLRMMPDIISSKSSFPYSIPIFHRSKKQREVGEFKNIKDEALKLLRSGQFDKAKAMVTKKLEAYRKKDNDIEMIFMLDMFMVEILILEGKFEDALLCQCIADIPSQEKGTIPSDFRISLYKAILLTMSKKVEDNDKAKYWWDQFTNNLFD